MAWCDSTSFIPVVFTCNAGEYYSKPNDSISISLQYESTTETTTQCKVRFKLNSLDGSNYKDKIYLLYNPNNIPEGRTLYTMKPWTGDSSGDWPYYSTEFWVYKDAFDASFVFEDFWICNDGWNNTAATVDAVYNTYYDTSCYRGNFSMHVKSGHIMNGIVAGGVGTGSFSITDLGNNSYRATGTRGQDGSHNAVKTATLYWSHSVTNNGSSLSYNMSSYNYEDFSKVNSVVNNTHTKTASFTPVGTYTYRPVYGGVETFGKHDDESDTGWQYFSQTVKQYFNPNQPSNLVLHADSYKNNRLTIKKPWIFTWTDSTPNSTTSPILGHYIRVEKWRGDTDSSEFITGLTYDNDGNLYKGTGTNVTIDRYKDYFNSTSENFHKVSFDPSATGIDFKAGDWVRLHVAPYTQWGDGSWRPTGNPDRSDVNESTTNFKTSDWYLVQNAGVVKVRVNNEFVEGVVKVRVNNEWKEADVVKARVNGEWEESV